MATGIEVRAVPSDTRPWLKSFGTIDCGYEMMRVAWPKLEHSFAVRRKGENVDSDIADPPRAVVIGHHRYPAKLLSQHPVDLLVVERGYLKHPTQGYQREPWEDLVRATDQAKRPKVVLEAWPSSAEFWNKGPVCKASLTRWSEAGYTSRCKLLNATRVGGAIAQSRLMVARVLHALAPQWTWPCEEAAAAMARPMSNLLTPPGLVRTKHHPGPIAEAASAKLEPMPNQPGAWIQTERGFRRLQLDEVGRGLGLNKASSTTAVPGPLKRTTSVFHWEYLSEILTNRDAASMTAPTRTSVQDHTTRPSPAVPAPPPFSWRPPDLSPEGAWYQQRLANLRAAVSTCPNPKKAWLDGLRMLRIHRSNYNADGPKPTRLQVLWWEFPPEHWEGLREGSRMNFLTDPQPRLNPNANMDEEQLQVAAAFVDELIDLGVVDTLAEGQAILLNAPLFVVPKEGQEGEWRVIADMLRGGQNMCIGNDPVVLPRMSHILEQLYEGGSSAVIDASKFFYQFPTHPADRKFLGLLHPISGILYAYRGLPMGAGTSPGLAGRYGLGFLRILKAKFDTFQGDRKANCWWTGFSELGYDPKLGYGFVLQGRDGVAVKVWAFVDDFLLHGPTHERTSKALQFFLDTALDCGMLCHPKKLTPPCQVVKYCGFLLDTTDVPCLRIPIGKRERALAMVEHILESKPSREFSRLSLAVAAGVLESLVDATPRRIGHTHLRNMHSTVHPSGAGTGAEPYYAKSTVGPDVRTDLEWWRHFLYHGGERYARSAASATLVPMWGDGSGTGTGGTFLLPDGPLQMWKGKWVPVVYDFTSNWKELATLKLSLERAIQAGEAKLRGTTVFYFTDNSTTYWIGASGSSPSPRLHQLIREIRMLELELGIQLEIVHVPGFIMIRQGTDGLSRGIWMTPLQALEDPHRLTRAIFDPLPFDALLVDQFYQRIPQQGLRRSAAPWQYRHWASTWDASTCFNRCTVWFPPPELARQVICFILDAWVEQPLTTSALIFVPRVVQAFWWGLCRHIRDLGTIYPHLTPLRCPPLVPLPVVVLYLPPHQRSLPTKDRLDRPPVPPEAHWHREQAAQMRGLSPRPVNGSQCP
jgi:hypothetical protein